MLVDVSSCVCVAAHSPHHLVVVGGHACRCVILCVAVYSPHHLAVGGGHAASCSNGGSVIHRRFH